MDWEPEGIADEEAWGEELLEALLEGEELMTPDHLTWQFSGVTRGSYRQARAAAGHIDNQTVSRSLFTRETILKSLGNAQQNYLERMERDHRVRPSTVNHFHSGLKRHRPGAGCTLVHNHRHGFSGETD